MNTIIEQFYKGDLMFRYDLEQEIEKYKEIIQKLEDEDIYQGDMYYQDSLMTLSALEEALECLHEYYEEDGEVLNFIQNNN